MITVGTSGRAKLSKRPIYQWAQMSAGRVLQGPKIAKASFSYSSGCGRKLVTSWELSRGEPEAIH